MRLCVLFILLASAAHAQRGDTINLLELKGSDLDLWERTQRTSDSRPLSLEELEKLAGAGIGEDTLVEMMRTRKVMVLADADTLLRLKKAGASDKVVGAVSAYAVPPNEGIELFLELHVRSPAGVGQAPHLYIEAWHEGKARQEALIHADLRRLLAGAPAQRDRSDRLLGENHRTVRRRIPIKTREAGAITLRVLVTQKAGLTGLSAESTRAFTLDYPAVSLEQRCRLQMTLARDAAMPDVYTIEAADLDCRWD